MLAKACSFGRHRLRLVALAVAPALALAGGVGSPASVTAVAAGDSCVRDFFEVARAQYGWSPQDVVQIINTDGDPTFQVDNVGHLRERLANAELGIIDQDGVYHICPNPS